MTEVNEPEPTPEILFAESGASWLWLLAGPAAGLAMFLIQLNSGLGVRWVVPLAFFLLAIVFFLTIPRIGVGFFFREFLARHSPVRRCVDGAVLAFGQM